MYLARHLLDRQIVDRDGYMIGNVDDLAFGVDEDGKSYVATLLVGQIALGQRLGGRLGRLLVAVARRLSRAPDGGPLEIPYALVDRIGSAIHLSCARERLPEPPLESWLRQHVINRIPGGGRAGR